MKKIIYILCAFLILQSCEKINLKEADNNVAVIEGYISPGKFVSLTISKQLVYDSDETEIQKLNDLEVYIEYSDTTCLLENIGNGVYIDTLLNISENEIYDLKFEYKGIIVRAETTIPEKPDSFNITETTLETFSMDNFTPGSGAPPERPEDVTISWYNPNGLYHMIVVECIEDDPVQINNDINRPARAFRNSPTQSDSQTINPMTFLYYGRHRIILFRLNTEYAALYERLGSSSLDITAPPSNIENGLGIFTGINSDTLLVTVVEN